MQAVLYNSSWQTRTEHFGSNDVQHNWSASVTGPEAPILGRTIGEIQQSCIALRYIGFDDQGRSTGL